MTLKPFSLVLMASIFIGSKPIFAQHCNCHAEPELRSIINCKPVCFKNGAKLFWQYNCDSSWLVYKNSHGGRQVIFSMEFVDLTGLLGFSYVQENKHSFTIENRQISGCCAPLQYRLFDKETGRQLRDFGDCIWYSNESQYNFLLYFIDGSDHKIRFYFIDKEKYLDLTIPKGRFKSHLFVAPELAFEDANIENGRFKIYYKYQLPKQKETWSKDSIIVDLSRY